MALDDLVQRAIEMGVRHFELADISDEGEAPMWHWDVYCEEPRAWHYLPDLTDFEFEWLGFGVGRRRPLGILPFRMGFCRTFIVMTPKRVERAGCQGVVLDSIEDGLAHALRAFVCDFDRATCPYDWCHDREGCDWVDGDWA